MLILALDAALARCSAVVMADGQVAAERQQQTGGRDHAAVLAPMADDVLRTAGCAAAGLNGVAVVVGPGSFTGLRAAIALAQGIALAAGCPAVGVTVGEALAAGLPPLPGWALWVAIDSRRGRIFLDRNGTIQSLALSELPAPTERLAVAGDAAIEVAARLAARGATVMLTDARTPHARDVAMVGERRLKGELPPLPAQPLYIDPPEARLPQGGLRPPPERAA
jgi:tRNA threonylcarbamoyl adenosine modification protein YeaZ